MNNLKKQAENLGIEVDGRWSDETLKQKIEEAKAQRSGAEQGKTSQPAEPVNTDEARDVPSFGGVRVETSEEIRQAEAGENLPVAPYEGDAKQLHVVSAGISGRSLSDPGLRDVPPEMDTTDIVNMPEQGEQEELYPIRLLVDWWDGQGNRHARNTEVDVPWNEAKKLIGEGKAERADAFTPSRG